ncbi:hypothetical protein DF021_18430 [Burkholderia stagnalis]|uniref:Uncharacterized protein n=1 Tax=Burkholderia stagnalis TaxID=1503054 RepID=A0ABX9YL34_9BURK|nr:hypothetical protein DF158_19485 [Burkholderia stagnalis]RQQ67459.1 hypothetical protein DF137_19135 [Burkholderia stagnalis]RQQ69053.1 hypothetical protein DF139_16535 [Burkholderia stagnalis]RQQ79615.1 hypothetical protein DF138_17745 [Burkholderia stagnalis]RQQ88775.1 hypothetical protein DF136_18575 [Burkholderia stagnalis]
MSDQISITIDNAGLNTIYSGGHYVTLVKDVVAQPPAQGSLPIAWIAFQSLVTAATTLHISVDSARPRPSSTCRISWRCSCRRGRTAW